MWALILLATSSSSATAAAARPVVLADGKSGFSYSFTSVSPLPADSPLAKSLLAALQAKSAVLGSKTPVAEITNSLDVPASGVDVSAAAHLVPVAVTAQFHAQDGRGGYRFGYTGPDSARVEQRSAGGVVQGWYSYRDADGTPQKVDYVADRNGYRVAFSLLPVRVAAGL
ncbi:larval cuticle protein A1A-like [Pollicipes pollicipes]|uniref:larval cuticle protein A1A-like n=1 Tax=Pollicipes pollicipes TaxID=41117 RepID=UPI001884EB23|nr:larval cuticle protein A1A-like [Pollicipes pollicipes]